MKRILYVLALVILTAGVASAQKKEASIIVVGDSIHDFGKLRQTDKPVTHIFKIKNDGGSPLVLSEVLSSCACTVVDWPKMPIAPGSAGDIKATFDPAHYSNPGTMTRTIRVFSNVNTDPLLLRVKVEIIR